MNKLSWILSLAIFLAFNVSELDAKGPHGNSSRSRDNKSAKSGHRRAKVHGAKKAPAPQAKNQGKNKVAVQPIAHSGGKSAKSGHRRAKVHGAAKAPAPQAKK